MIRWEEISPDDRNTERDCDGVVEVDMYTTANVARNQPKLISNNKRQKSQKRRSPKRRPASDSGKNKSHSI